MLNDGARKTKSKLLLLFILLSESQINNHIDTD